MAKPHIVKLAGAWWCFNTRSESRKSKRAWVGGTPSVAYQRWANFNTMKR